MDLEIGFDRTNMLDLLGDVNERGALSQGPLQLGIIIAWKDIQLQADGGIIRQARSALRDLRLFRVGHRVVTSSWPSRGFYGS